MRSRLQPDQGGEYPALIVAPIAAYLVDWLSDINLTEQHFVALAIGLFGFVAVAAAADVLARSVVTAAETKARPSSTLALTSSGSKSRREGS